MIKTILAKSCLNFYEKSSKQRSVALCCLATLGIPFLFATEAVAQSTRPRVPVGPGSYELRCFSNGDGRTATVNFTADGEGVDLVSRIGVSHFHRQGEPPTIRGTLSVGGQPQAGDQYEVAFPGPGRYRVETRADAFVTFVGSGSFQIPPASTSCSIL